MEFLTQYFIQVIFEATWAKRGFVGVDDVCVTSKGNSVEVIKISNMVALYRFLKWFTVRIFNGWGC